MKLDLFQIDSFTDDVFKGNPACVVPLKKWLSDDILLNIAKENAVAETAFFIDKGEKFHLRWFTPEIEMDLCGHATLAAAHCLKSVLAYKKDKIIFETLSGELIITFENNYYSMDLPSRMPVRSELPEVILQALNIMPKEVYKSRDYLLVYENEELIKKIVINKQIFDQINLGHGGVIVTSQGSNYDFVSRFFTSQSSILEDPVTGSSHCSLTPFWAKKLNKSSMIASQLSQRGGIIACLDKEDRVIISGKAKTYSKGVLWTK
tara:strand:+ start:1322 stop:2110 length:789 start_codon:yes stop_codon:yes gene_type:complete